MACAFVGTLGVHTVSLVATYIRSLLTFVDVFFAVVVSPPAWFADHTSLSWVTRESVGAAATCIGTVRSPLAFFTSWKYQMKRLTTFITWIFLTKMQIHLYFVWFNRTLTRQGTHGIKFLKKLKGFNFQQKALPKVWRWQQQHHSRTHYQNKKFCMLNSKPNKILLCHIREHDVIVKSSVYPSLQLHVAPPSVFMQSWSHSPVAHSFTSSETIMKMKMTIGNKH